jgi:hypothetical protein
MGVFADTIVATPGMQVQTEQGVAVVTQDHDMQLITGPDAGKSVNCAGDIVRDGVKWEDEHIVPQPGEPGYIEPHRVPWSESSLRGLKNAVFIVDEGGFDATAYRDAVIDATLKPFDAFDAAAQDRIRHAAKRIAKQRRKARGVANGGAWRITYDVKLNEGGTTRADYNANGFPSRGDAVAKLRWLLSDRKTAAYWRTVSINVEYRP